ncbi:MAG: class I SAM-dependent methyltransferase [Hadesarchaea archaeon]|nr:class I SAM-dependent methyltransferase [Hadesarchaea archaeon]
MTAPRLAKRIDWVCEHVKSKNVLDVGCVGDFHHMNIPNDKSLLHPRIAACAKSVLGVDINREGIERMRNLGYNVIYANSENFVSERKFDVVVLGACVEHMDNPGLVLDRAWENLREKGHLIITTPNARYLGVAFKEMVGRDHRLIYTLKHLSQMLGHHGFRVVEVQFFRDEGKLNLVGKLYERVLLRFFPLLAMKFGVIAEKVESVRRGGDEAPRARRVGR